MDKDRRTRNFTVALLLGVLAAPVVAGASGAATSSTVPSERLANLTGTVSGSGSTLADRFYRAGITGFAAAAKQVRVEYKAIGSGRGKAEFGNGVTDFAGTDSLVKDGDGPRSGEFIYVPLTAGAIAVAFRVQGVDDLNLSPGPWRRSSSATSGAGTTLRS